MENKNFISVDTSDAVNDELFEAAEKVIKEINHKIISGKYKGYQVVNCFRPFEASEPKTIEKIKSFANLLEQEQIDYLVVISNSTTAIQSQALVDLYSNVFKDKDKQKTTEILYVSNIITTSDMIKLLAKLENKSFAINVISQNGKDFNTLVLFHELRALLLKKFSSDSAKKYIIITTNNNYGELFYQARDYKYSHLVILDNNHEKFFAYSPAVLLPLAVAGIDIDKYLLGAENANKKYNEASLINNEPYRYATARFRFYKESRIIENIFSFSKSEFSLAKLFSMVFLEVGNKAKKGINSYFWDGYEINNAFLNIVASNPVPSFNTAIINNSSIYDKNVSTFSDTEDEYLNYLSNLTYNSIGKIMSNTFLENLVNYCKTPTIKITINDLENNEAYGWIIAFIYRAAIMFGYLMDYDPFESNGTPYMYNVELVKNLKKKRGTNND
ncbi:glucose-6-phosphate isomerase [Mycoplasma struthionis]|uniref:Glucose-6-phosphate isomerase n=1 Tax=Mycoplasma struthionis TaxID=538220 RepID=A0A3G8LH42_9MOLU|nr:hypothetical protein [Mycoplasma struthionis]AZG68654.1 hypothetical protein EGN60_01575 [Mycoplasma struthionis]TPI01908.1 hypothetical protein FJM01_01430 [Mycoplasma struthionis]